jgi:hypothetical protein
MAWLAYVCSIYAGSGIYARLSMRIQVPMREAYLVPPLGGILGGFIYTAS